MANRRVVIKVSPSRLEVAAVRGDRVAESRVRRLPTAGYTEGWPGVLTGLARPLQEMVAELDAAGAAAAILYSAPTTATGLFSCPASAGRAQTAKAAALALAEMAEFPLASNPHDMVPLAPDRSAGTDGKQQNHTLVLAEADATALALTRWAAGAGLRPLEIVPSDAVSLASAVRVAQDRSSGGVAVVIHVGEHGSVLAAASDGRLRFVRQLAIGVETFVEALAGRSADGPGPEYPFASADLVFGIGIPTRDQATGAGHTAQAAAILPTFQPILQRFIVDLKQSLRFGLEEQERKQAVLIGIGPGAVIPRLLSVIAEQSDLRLEQPGAGSADGAKAPSCTIPAFLGLRKLNIDLLPRSLRAELTTTRVKRGLWAGIAAAGVLVAGGAVLARSELSRQREEAGRIKARLEAARPVLELGAEVTAAQGGVAAAKQRMASRLNQTAEWDAALAMLSRLTPKSIKLTDVQFTLAQGKPVCRIVGHTSLAGAGDANGSLKEYLDALSRVPIVRSCRLGATQRVESDGAARLGFEATLSLVEMPPRQSETKLITSVPTEEGR